MSPRREQTPYGHGVLIEQHDPQPVIRQHAEEASDWAYREQAAFLYRWAVVFKDRLLDPVLLTDRRRMPDPVISFEKMNVKVLAAYTLVRNPQGLLCEITFNAAHFEDRQWSFGQWGELETLLHEQVHLWQQNFGEHPVRPGRAYHNREFVDKCESLGLYPLLGVGCHIKPADGIFELLMREHGIEREQWQEEEGAKPLDWWNAGKERRGSSTLSKWSCGCQNVRVGTKDFYAVCTKCGNEFIKVENRAPQEAGQASSATGSLPASADEVVHQVEHTQSHRPGVRDGK